MNSLPSYFTDRHISEMWIWFMHKFNHCSAIYNKKISNILIVQKPKKIKYLSVLVAQLCPTFCNPTDCSQPGSSVHGVL